MVNNVTFKRAGAEGFRSLVSPVSFDLDLPGINLLNAPNGAGKTTRFEIIVWVLFKQTLKGGSHLKVVTWPEKRNENFRGTRAWVAFEVNDYCYVVYRHINFKGFMGDIKAESRLFIHKIPKTYPENDEIGNQFLVGDEQHKGDQEAYIIRLLGVDGKAFVNSVLFGQRMSRLVSMPNDKKRELFEQLFELEFVEQAKEKAKVKLQELEKEVSNLSTELSTLDNSLIYTKKSLDYKEDKLREFNETKKEDTLKVTQAANNLMKKLAKEIDELTAAKKIYDEYIVESRETAGKNYTALTTELNSFAAVMRSKFDAKLSVFDVEISQLQADRQKLESEIRQLGYDLQDSVRQQARITSEFNKADNNVKRLETEKNNVATICPTCEGPIKPDKIQQAKTNIDKQLKIEKQVRKTQLLSLAKEQKNTNAISVKQEELKNDLQAKTNRQIELNGEMDKVEDEVEDIQKLRELKKSIETAKSVLDNITEREKVKKVHSDVVVKADRLKFETETLLKNYRDQLLKLEALKPPSFDLEADKTEIEALTIKIDELSLKSKELYTQRDRVIWWVDKGFSSSGLKSFVFNAMLNRLNAYAEKYASRLGTRVKFSVDLSKPSKPFTTTVYVNGLEKDYEDFSGGESQRVDVCLAFAMFDLVSNKINTNIIIMDEIMENLDEDGIEAVFDLVRMKANDGKAIFLITHNKSIDSMMCRHISLDAVA